MACSTRISSRRPGDDVSMEIAHATTPREAAEIFPANYWFALLELPQEAPFPLLEKKATRLATALGFSGVR